MKGCGTKRVVLQAASMSTVFVEEASGNHISLHCWTDEQDGQTAGQQQEASRQAEEAAAGRQQAAGQAERAASKQQDRQRTDRQTMQVQLYSTYHFTPQSKTGKRVRTGFKVEMNGNENAREGKNRTVVEKPIESKKVCDSDAMQSTDTQTRQRETKRRPQRKDRQKRTKGDKKREKKETRQERRRAEKQTTDNTQRRRERHREQRKQDRDPDKTDNRTVCEAS